MSLTKTWHCLETRVVMDLAHSNQAASTDVEI